MPTQAKLYDKHHSHASQTQDSVSGKATETYKDGAKAGSGGKKSDPDGKAPAAGRNTYTGND